MADTDLERLSGLVNAEIARRQRGRARFEKATLSRKYKRDPRCPYCKSAACRDGRRHDGVQRYVCKSCGRHFSDTSSTSLSSSKLDTGTIATIVSLIMYDCPNWVVAKVASVSERTAQYWRDRCLDAANSWASEGSLRGTVWIDEMRFAPTRASESEVERNVTYNGTIAKDCYLEVAFDSHGNGFCTMFAKAGMPSREMVCSALAHRIEPKARLIHDGARCHNMLVRERSLEDIWCKFVPGDSEYETRMKLMSNCCSYIRHSFESHVGIRYSKIESYANFFLYRWSHVRKHGMKTSIEYLLARVAGTEKKINCSLPKEKDAN